MPWQEVVRRWFRGERDEAAQWKAEAERTLDAELSRREEELRATPEQRIDMLRDEMAANDAEMEAIRRRAASGGSEAGPPAN